MKLRNFQTLLASVACIGMTCPPIAMASNLADGAKDVALRPGGVLVGQVIDPQGAVQPGSVVSIQHHGQEVVRTTTDTNGIFAAQGLRGGQYNLVTQDGQSFCRLWAADTAPPAASDSAVVVTDQDVVRGQWGATQGGLWLDWVRSHPYITAGVVAAAIATPIAIAASDDDDGPNS